MSPQTACWMNNGRPLVAAVAEGNLYLAAMTAGTLHPVATVPAHGIATLAVGRWRGRPILLAAKGRTLVRFDLPRRTWRVLGVANAPIREILPDPNDAAAVLLTSSATTSTPRDGAVWWAHWSGRCTITRVSGVKPTFHPWQLWWASAAGERRLAVASYKATPYVHFEHNCMFLFVWHAYGVVEPRWLGSRLTRPYLDATHAPVRTRDDTTMVAIEITRDGGHGLSAYHPIGFGYEGEWHTESLPGLQRVAAYGPVITCWFRATDGAWRVQRILPDGDAYRLVSIPMAPPAPESLCLLDTHHLSGWWGDAWHVVTLPDC